ncbi:hypothetical protein ABW20_dc0106103 [Dactylellina cionopaga]|nr:hypothetical protein ABW20_dc0106103 [Dactylellina cionopaga]
MHKWQEYEKHKFSDSCRSWIKNHTYTALIRISSSYEYESRLFLTLEQRVPVEYWTAYIDPDTKEITCTRVSDDDEYILEEIFAGFKASSAPETKIYHWETSRREGLGQVERRDWYLADLVAAMIFKYNAIYFTLPNLGTERKPLYKPYGPKGALTKYSGSSLWARTDWFDHLGRAYTTPHIQSSYVQYASNNIRVEI